MLDRRRRKEYSYAAWRRAWAAVRECRRVWRLRERIRRGDGYRPQHGLGRARAVEMAVTELRQRLEQDIDRLLDQHSDDTGVVNPSELRREQSADPRPKQDK